MDGLASNIALLRIGQVTESTETAGISFVYHCEKLAALRTSAGSVWLGSQINIVSGLVRTSAQ